MNERIHFQDTRVPEEYAAYATDNFSPGGNRAKGVRLLRYMLPILIIFSELQFSLKAGRWRGTDTFWVSVAIAWFAFFPLASVAAP